MPRRTGKYASIIDNLKKLPVIDPKQQDKVDARKREILKSLYQLDELQADAITQIGSLMRTVNTALEQVNMLLVAGPAGRQHGSVLARYYAETREVLDAIDAQESNLNVTLEAFEQMIVEQYEAEGTTSIRLTEGGTVRVQTEPKAVVEDRDAFRDWCIRNGLERSLQLAWQTTNALTKERLLKGEPEPTGVKAYAADKLVYTR